MARLSNASKSAASKVASKLSSAPSPATTTGSGSPLQPSSRAEVTIPGLSEITPDAVTGMLPQFNENQYQISDPLNPPDSLPQATEAQFERGMSIYAGSQRALKLVGSAFDTTKERFTTIGKQASAIGAGVKAATSVEKVKGDLLDYQAQLETNAQKGITLDVARHKTATELNAAPHNKAAMDEKLKQAAIAADLSREQTQSKQGQLSEFRKSLGEYAGK